MERLTNTKKSGITGSGLRTWGMIFCILGIIGRGILQNRFLGTGSLSAQQLLEVMQSSENAMIAATLSLVLQAMETCAVPIFALLMLEGFQHTMDLRQYFLRVAGLAVLTELPYNLAISGKLFAADSRNPVFGLVLCLLMLYFYRRYAEKTFRNTLIKVIVTVAGILWTVMLKIDFGTGLVLIMAIMWACRRKPIYRNMAGAVMAIVCTLGNPFYLAAPMGFLAVHSYNGDQGADNRVVNYLAYPVLLLAVGLI